MANAYFVTAVVVIIFALIIHIYFICDDLVQLTEINKKPFIFGEDLCEDITKKRINITMETDFLRSIMYIPPVKHIYKGKLNGNDIYIKQLGTKSQFLEFETKFKNKFKNKQVHQLEYESIIFEIRKSLADLSTGLGFCPNGTNVLPLIEVLTMTRHGTLNEALTYIWLSIEISPEPLIHKIIQPPEWPLPKYYGTCGRLIFVEDAGKMLTDCNDEPWDVRSDLAVKLLKIAFQFTFDHPRFGFYWTDLSPDNVAVNENMDLKIVDLDSVYIVDKMAVGASPKWYQNYSTTEVNCEDCYSLFSHEICDYHTSDNNIRSVCKETLAPTSLFLEGGLLHDAPHTKEERLNKLLDLCIHAEGDQTRFQYAEGIIDLLQQTEM